jgi:hypothetical protein
MGYKTSKQYDALSNAYIQNLEMNAIKQT